MANRRPIVNVSGALTELPDADTLYALALSVGVASPGARAHVQAAAAGSKALIVQAFSGQTANLQEWQDSVGAILMAVSADGTPTSPGAGALSEHWGAGSTAAGANATVLGYGAACSGNDGTVLGYSAAANSVASCVVIGSGASIYTGGTAGAVAIGKAARAFKGVSLGFEAGKVITGGAAAQVLIGYRAGDAVTTASGLVAIGEDAGGAITNGAGNTAVGASAMTTVTTNDYNTAVGWTSGKSSGSRNTSVGAYAMDTGGSGSDNTCIGAAANGSTGATGSHNTLVGAYAMNAVGSVCTGSENTVVGSYAARNLAGAANYNVFLGRNAGTNASQLGAVTNSIAIGHGAYTTGHGGIAIGFAASAGANELVFGSPSQTAVDVYFGSGKLDTAPATVTVNGCGASGTDIAGAALTIAGGKGTGTGAGGAIIFKTATPDGSGSGLNALVERARFDDKGNLLFGMTTIGTSAVKVFGQSTGTAPSTSPTDAYQQYSKDENAVAGKACPHVRTEGGTESWVGEGARVSKCWLTPEGGLAVRVVAGENVAAGEVVYSKQTSGADGKVWLNPIDGDMPLGVAYAGASADADLWIVTNGIAAVLPNSADTATRGYVITSSSTTAGRVDQAATVPSATVHWREIGHFIDTGSGAGAATRAIVHFN